MAKPTEEARTFLEHAVKTNIREKHTTKFQICKKRTSEQNQQILALAATIALNQTRFKVINFRDQMMKNQKNLIGTQFSEV